MDENRAKTIIKKIDDWNINVKPKELNFSLQIDSIRQVKLVAVVAMLRKT